MILFSLPFTAFYASMAKALASRTAVENANLAVQVFGGAGFNTEYPVEKLYRDSKIFELYEGAGSLGVSLAYSYFSLLYSYRNQSNSASHHFSSPQRHLPFFINVN